MNNQCGIILLAAGSSARLGEPKQLLFFKESTLLQHSIEMALGSVAQQVVVVLGAHAQMLQQLPESKRLSVVINDDWQEGIASSIRCGLNYLLYQSPNLQSALFMVCDQPFINSILLDKLVTLQGQSDHAIVASEYAGTTGIPAIFASSLFPELLQLKGDAGAKKLIMQQAHSVATVAFPLGDIDIDTAADYEMMRKIETAK